MMKALLGIATVTTLGFSLAVAAASAAQLSPSSTPAATTRTDVVPVHGCHRGIQRDRGGWHYHGRACQRVQVPPPGLYDRSYNRRYYRGPFCQYRCRFVGPVKTCQQVCRR
jgi:hypothetical protein